MIAHTAAVLPRVVPIIPVLRPQPFDSPGWLFEPKFDGFRGIFYLSLEGCAMYSKRGNRFSRFRSCAGGSAASWGGGR